MTDNANSNLSAIAAAVALVVSLVGLFVLTGVVGRVQRNEGGLFLGALGFVVCAALVYVLAAQIAPGPDATENTTTKRLENGARAGRFIATLAGTVGIILAVVASVESARATERPVVTGAFASDDGRQFTATAKVSNLSSSRRVVVIVDALSEAGVNWEAHTIYQAYLGPDSEGNVDHSVTLRVPKGAHYEAIGVKAYTGVRDSTFDDTPCSTYPRQVSQNAQKDRVLKQGPGCVIMMAPEPATAQKATAPER